MKSDRMARRIFFGLAIIFVIFIVYASWTPGSGDGGTGWRQFRGFGQLDSMRLARNLRDITTNVLLYIPLGIFVSLAVSRRRPRFISVWLLVGTVVSLLMETGQAFLGRFPDVIDILTNTAGYLIGYWLVIAGVRFYHLDSCVFLGFDPDGEQDARMQSVAAIRFIYVCLYILVALLPFDISVSVSKIYAQLFPDDFGRVQIILDPVYHLPLWQQNGLKLTLELFALLPAGALTAFLNGTRGRFSIVSAVYPGVLVAIGCETAQLFIMSRTTDIVMIPVAVAAGVLGWLLVRAWFNLQKVEVKRDSGNHEKNWQPLMVALIGYGLVVAFFAWSPFRFELDVKTVARKILYESNLIPFREHFAVRNLSSAADIVKEAGIFLPMGILVSHILHETGPRLTRWKVIVLSGVICTGFGVFTELTQAFCIDRFVDLTDILLAGFGGTCGAMLRRLFQRGTITGRQ